MRRTNNGKYVWIEYLILNGFVLCGLIIILELWKTNLFIYPLQSGGDATQIAYIFKQMLETGLSGHSTQTSYPFYAYASDFPTSGIFSKIIQLLSILVMGGDYIVALNLYYLAGYFLAASTSYWVFRKLGISRGSAGVVSILYSFLPYHFMRGIGHLGLAMYWPIPIFLYFCIIYVKGEQGWVKGKKGWLTKDNIFHIIILIFLGGQSVYFAYFSCFFLCMTILYLIIRKESWKHIRQLFIDFGILLCAFLPMVILHGISVLIYGGNNSVMARKSVEVEQYGLKIGQLLLPVNGHRISALADLKSKYNKMPLTSENYMATLGLLLSIGFILLLIELIKNKHADEDIHACSILNFGALLLSTIGGVASIIALFFTQIRCYNRLSIFIAFLCAVTFAKFIDKYLIKIKKTVWYWTICLLLLGVGLFDQTIPSFAPNHKEIIAKWDNNKQFVKKIEEMEGAGAQIYQMPYMTYPEAGNRHNMYDYEHATGYLHSDTLIWSYGCYTGRKGDLWNKYLTALSLEKQIANLYLNGFDGVYVDSYAYTDAEFEELYEKLTDITGTEPILSQNKRLYYFTLSNYAIAEISEDDYLLAKTFFGFGENFYEIEKSETDYWVWSNGEGSITIYNEANNEIPVQVFAEVSTLIGKGEYKLSIDIEGTRKDFAITTGEQNFINFEMLLKPGENIIKLQSNIPIVELDTDTRELSFNIRNFSYKQLREIAESAKESFDFRIGGDLSALNIVRGLSTAEENYSWTDGDCLEMNCHFGESRSLHGTIEVPQVFNRQQKIAVVVDGEKVFDKLVRNNEKIEFDFISNNEGLTNIQILISDAASPLSLGMSGDVRKLGLAIQSITFEPIDIPAEAVENNNLLARTFYEFGEGFYEPEKSQTGYWVWSRGAGIISIHNETDREIPVQAFADISILSDEGEYTLSIDVEGTPIDFTITTEKRNQISFNMVLKPGENIIKLQSNIPVVKLDTDTRELSFNLTNFSYQYLEGNEDASR